jgi:hypothetical protein
MLISMPFTYKLFTINFIENFVKKLAIQYQLVRWLNHWFPCRIGATVLESFSFVISVNFSSNYVAYPFTLENVWSRVRGWVMI